MAIITISRGTFSGGEKLSELVAEKLGYKCLSREVLLEASQKYNVSLKELAHTLDDAPGILERMGMEKRHYLSCIKAMLLSDVKEENVVYHGHAGHLLLKGIPHILRIRIIAGIDYKIKAAMEKHGFDEDQAARFIKNIDRERVQWTHFLYHEDINDHSLYDLIINIERHTTLESACGVICSAIETPEYIQTPESQKEIKDIIFAAEIEAGISLTPGINGESISVESNSGIVKLSGEAESLKDADKIREFVRKLPGVEDVKGNLHVKSWSLSGMAS